MNRLVTQLIFFTTLVLASTSIAAVENLSHPLPVIERPVVKVSIMPNDGLHISIPVDALIMRNNIPGVFVVENNEARFRMVRLGKISSSKVEILSGLFGDETLVNGGLEDVHDGSPISVLTKKPAVKK